MARRNISGTRIVAELDPCLAGLIYEYAYARGLVRLVMGNSMNGWASAPDGSMDGVSCSMLFHGSSILPAHFQSSREKFALRVDVHVDYL